MSYRVNKKEHEALNRMFVHTFNGRTVIGREIITNATRITLSMLHSLTRKGLIVYEENEPFGSMFGVTAWNVHLTDAGRKEVST